MTTRWVLLAAALGWSVVSVVVLVSYHLAEPRGVRSITTNGHTYVGRPPALTLFERDPPSVVIIVGLLGVALIVAVVDLSLRRRSAGTRTGVVAVAIGATLCALSLFGLFYGVASLDVIGALVVLSGLRVRTK